MLFNDSVINARKNKVAKALDQVLNPEDVVVVHCGSPIQKPGGHDQTYPFLPHPDYFWLTGMRRPAGVSVYTKNDGWLDFVAPITRDEKIWEGESGIYKGKDLNELDQWLGKRKAYNLGQSSYPAAPQEVLEAFNEVRRVKDSSEIELIGQIAHMANAGYRRIKHFIRPGVSERQIQIEYESDVLRAGSEKFPYDTIVGSGTNASILHAIPTPRVIKDGEIVLIDAGADIADYCVDITRVFAVNGVFNTQQQAIYDIVLAAQAKSISLCRPGVEWSEVHLAAALIMADGLQGLGILKCGPDEAVSSGVISVFFPHGVGHMVGLRVRDVGGPINPHPKKYAGARLRVDMPLKEGHLMTVEPGLYFIEALLQDEETRRTYKDLIHWSEVKKWQEMGGVRIEDDIHITSQGPHNLTAMVEK